MEFITAHLDVIIWIALAVLFAIIEGATVSVVSIWFVGGCIIAVFLALCGLPAWLQVIAAIVVSGALLGVCRKMIVNNKNAKKALAEDDIANSAEGKTAVVTEAISKGKDGQILIGGSYWTARAYNEEDSFDVDTRVIVIRVDGLCCIVDAAPTI